MSNVKISSICLYQLPPTDENLYSIIRTPCRSNFAHPTIFDSFFCVSFADLSRNRLAKVTNGAFVNLSNLTYLDISYNKLVKLESVSVEPLKKLHTLNISGNAQMDLYDIRESFQVSSQLKHFFCSIFHSPFPYFWSLNILQFRA